MQSRVATLWCNGLSPVKTTSKRPHSSDSAESNEGGKTLRVKWHKTALEEKADRVDDTMDELRQKHGSGLTSLQYRV